MGFPMQLSANPLLSNPEYIGSGGYVWAGYFEPGLPPGHDNVASIRIRPVRWLTHSLSYLGVQGVDIEAFQVANGTAWRARLDLSVPRRQHADDPIELSLFGNHSMDIAVAEKNAVIAAVDLLADVGYALPTYSTMLLQYMDEEARYNDVVDLCYAKAQQNTLHLVPDGSMTYAGCSFEEIFDQCMDRCHYAWEYASELPLLTTQGYQAKIHATKKGTNDDPSLIVLSKPCRRRAEAIENVLCTALSYINDDCGYKIGDLHFDDLMLRRIQRQYPDIF